MSNVTSEELIRVKHHFYTSPLVSCLAQEFGESPNSRAKQATANTPFSEIFVLVGLGETNKTAKNWSFSENILLLIR